MNTTKNLIQQTSSMAPIARQIGNTLWWDLSKCSVSRVDLERYAKSHGLPTKYLPEQIKFIGAFKRAISDVKTSLDKSHNILLRKVNNDSSDLSYAIVCEEVQNGAKKTKHTQIGLVIAHKDREKIEYQDSGIDSSSVDTVKYSLNSAYQDALYYNTNDIRSIITRFTGECGMSLRNSGGVYFVPQKYSDLLNAVSNFTQDCSPSAVLYIKPEYIINDSDLKAYQMVSQSELASEIVKLETQYQELQGELESLLRNPAELGAKKQKQLVNQLVEYKGMKERIEVFSDTLNISSNDLMYRLKNIHESMQSKLGQLGVTISSNLRANFSGTTQNARVVPAQQPVAPVVTQQSIVQKTPEQLAREAALEKMRLSMNKRGL